MSPSEPPPTWSQPLTDAFSAHFEQDIVPIQAWVARLRNQLGGLSGLEVLGPVSSTVTDLGWSVPEEDFLIPIASDAEDEAHFGFGGEDSGIVVGRVSGQPRIERYLLSDIAETELQELRNSLRRLEGWRGRVMLLGLSVAGRFLAGSPHGPRDRVPAGVVSFVEELRELLGELDPLVDHALTSHASFLQQCGSQEAIEQFAGFEQVTRRFLPQISIHEPYELPDSDQIFGAVVLLRFPGIGRSRLEIPLALEWSADRGRVVDAYPAIKGLWKDPSPPEATERAEPCFGCEGTGLGTNRQLPTGGFASWMRPWYRLMTSHGSTEPDLLSALSPPKALCHRCQGYGWVRWIEKESRVSQEPVDQDLAPSSDLILASAREIVESSRRLRPDALAHLGLLVATAVGLVVGLEWFRRAIGDMPPQLHVVFWLLCVPLVYFVVGAVYHGARYGKLQWTSPGVDGEELLPGLW